MNTSILVVDDDDAHRGMLRMMLQSWGYTVDEALLASQLLAFCEGMLSRFVRSEFKYRPTDDFDARWPLVAAQLK